MRLTTGFDGSKIVLSDRFYMKGTVLHSDNCEHLIEPADSIGAGLVFDSVPLPTNCYNHRSTLTREYVGVSPFRGVLDLATMTAWQGE